jgi:hypothetical protein
VTERRQSLVMWFGVAAPPLAWVVQLLFGWLVDEARCGRGSMRWGIDDHLWEAAISVGAIAVAAAGLAAALATLRAVRAGAGDARGRVHFLAVTSASAAAVFVLLTIITLAGVVSQEPCRG